MPTKIQLIQGDITKIEVDIIVNAANTSLLGGGGVDGAIHRAGGAAILEDCQKIRARQGKCATGEAVITTAGKLPATYVIHTVGPVWQDGTKGEFLLLANCYRNSLRLAVEHGAKSIAFPNIATGIYGFPKREACAVALAQTQIFLATSSADLTVTFVNFETENQQLYQEGLESSWHYVLADELIADIKTAFQDSPFPSETLQQSELRDDYIDNGPRWEAAAVLDKQYQHWSEIPSSLLAKCPFALTYMQPDGLLYYYPAYMVAALRHWQQAKEDEDFINSLEAIFQTLNYQRAERFVAFSSEQWKCIKRLLTFAATFTYYHEAENLLEDW